MLSCSLLRPWAARVENCQLRTSESWLHVARGGLQKNARFWASWRPGRLHGKLWHAHTCTSSIIMTTTLAHPGFISQKVVPHDGRPASRQLAHIRDDHQRQRTRLEGLGTHGEKEATRAEGWQRSEADWPPGRWWGPALWNKPQNWGSGAPPSQTVGPETHTHTKHTFRQDFTHKPLFILLSQLKIAVLGSVLCILYSHR